MSERLTTQLRPDGKHVVCCVPCTETYGTTRFLARTDALGLWLYCKHCHQERLWVWTAVATTLINFCGPQVGASLLLPAGSLAEGLARR